MKIRSLDVRWMPPDGWRSEPRYVLLDGFIIAGVLVPAGFESDGATVPLLLRWLFPPADRYFPAAIAHDFLLKQKSISRKMADSIFYHALGQCGISTVRRWIMYAAVRVQSLSKNWL
jgi:hypothetical protein